MCLVALFFFSSRRRHTRSLCDWSSDVCSSDLPYPRGWLGEALTLLAFNGPAATADSLLAAAVAGRSGWYRIHELRAVRSEERRVGKECSGRRAPDPKR